MASENEAIADIVAMIRHAAYVQTADTPQSVLRLADRIEAAWNRERAKIEADALAAGGIVEAARHEGNAAARREALDGMLILACGICENTLCPNKNGCEDGMTERCDFVNKANSALAAPPRNCDVGTAEEQRERFLKFCTSQNCESGCKFRNEKDMFCCDFAWAQMPYAEGGAK